jgi:hypothetical protein
MIVTDTFISIYVCDSVIVDNIKVISLNTTVLKTNNLCTPQASTTQALQYYN